MVLLFTDGLVLQDVLLPPDVLDTALALLCVSLIVTYPQDVLSQRLAFRFPSVSLRLRTVLSSLTTVALPDTVMAAGNTFVSVCDKFQHIDLKNTALQRFGTFFCEELSQTYLPDTVTKVGKAFLLGSDSVADVSGYTTVQSTLPLVLQRKTKREGERARRKNSKKKREKKNNK